MGGPKNIFLLVLVYTRDSPGETGRSWTVTPSGVYFLRESGFLDLFIFSKQNQKLYVFQRNTKNAEIEFYQAFQIILTNDKKLRMRSKEIYTVFPIIFVFVLSPGRSGGAGAPQTSCTLQYGLVQ